MPQVLADLRKICEVRQTRNHSTHSGYRQAVNKSEAYGLGREIPRLTSTKSKHFKPLSLDAVNFSELSDPPKRRNFRATTHMAVRPVEFPNSDAVCSKLRPARFSSYFLTLAVQGQRVSSCFCRRSPCSQLSPTGRGR